MAVSRDSRRCSRSSRLRTHQGRPFFRVLFGVQSRTGFRELFSRAASSLTVASLLATAPVSSGCLAETDFGPWTKLSTSQFGVALYPGTTTVEVRDVHDGWTERVSVVSDGRSVTDGIDKEPVLPAIAAKIPDADRAALRGDGSDPIPDTGSALDRAAAVNGWIVRRIDSFHLDRPGAGSSAGGEAASSRALPSSDGRNPHVIAASPQTSRPREGQAPIESENACEILKSIEEGARSNCLSFASIFRDVGTIAGLTIRRVDFCVRFGSPFEGHSVDEVWSPETGKWFVVDAYFQCIWTVDGTPASAIELHRAAVEGRARSIGFKSTGLGGVSLSGSRVNPRLYPRNVMVRVASGAWLTRTSGAPAPVVDGNIIQCDDDAVFEAPPGAADEYSARRDSSHGRIVFQAIDGRLVVGLNRKSFEADRFEARVTAERSIEQFDETAGYDPGDPEIATGPELVARTKLVDDDGDATPDGWSVDRSLALFETTPDGAAVLETGPDGATLTLVPKLAADFASGVGFARMSVDRGSANFSASGRMAGQKFVVRAGRETTACTPISGFASLADGLRLEILPNSRVTVAWVSLRRTPAYGDLDGAEVP